MTIDMTKYTDTKNLRRINKKGYAGWQFVSNRKDFKETKHFNDGKHGSSEEAYKAAIKYRDEFLEVISELGAIERDKLPLNLSLSPRNTSGIVGVSRASRKRDDRKTREEEWVTNYKDSNGVNRQKKFTVSLLGEKMALYEAIKYRREFIIRVISTVEATDSRKYVEDHIEELSDLMSYIDELQDDSDVFFFLGTINNPLLDSTEKQEIINIRIGQKKFRRLVMNMWNHKCAVTGASHFLNAGHIRPWRDSNNAERLDPYNGFPLSPIYDKAFDTGLISFDQEGKILISSKLSDEAELLGVSTGDSISGLNFMHQKYLEYHRNYIFNS